MSNRLETMLKNKMNYSEDQTVRCSNCINGDFEIEGNPAEPDYYLSAVGVCTANKAIEIEVSEGGRCDYFSARRATRTPADDRARELSQQRAEEAQEELGEDEKPDPDGRADD